MSGSTEREPLPIESQAEITEEDRLNGYRVTLWHQHKNYECLQCQYATLWLPKMLDHLAEDIHLWSYPGASVGEEEETDDETPTY